MIYVLPNLTWRASIPFMPLLPPAHMKPNLLTQ